MRVDAISVADVKRVARAHLVDVDPVVAAMGSIQVSYSRGASALFVARF